MTASAASEREVALEAPDGEVVLCLRESPTTGYLWRMVALPPELEVVDSRFVVAGGALGSGGERRVTLRARERGEFTFAAESARADEPADERVHVTVTVARPWSA